MRGLKIQEIGNLLSSGVEATDVDAEELAKIIEGDDLFDLSQDIINEEEEEIEYDNGE